VVSLALREQAQALPLRRALVLLEELLESSEKFQHFVCLAARDVHVQLDLVRCRCRFAALLHFVASVMRRGDDEIHQVARGDGLAVADDDFVNRHTQPLDSAGICHQALDDCLQQRAVLLEVEEFFSLLDPLVVVDLEVGAPAVQELAECELPVPVLTPVTFTGVVGDISDEKQLWQATHSFLPN